MKGSLDKRKQGVGTSGFQRGHSQGLSFISLREIMISRSSERAIFFGTYVGKAVRPIP